MFFGSDCGHQGEGLGLPFSLKANRSLCPVTRNQNTKHSITYMPELSINIFQINLYCCHRRRRSDRAALGLFESETASDTFSEFELVTSRYPWNRARLRWIKAILAAIIRQRILRAWVQLGQIAKRNKAANTPDPTVSRLWGQTGHWLQKHKL